MRLSGEIFLVRGRHHGMLSMMAFNIECLVMVRSASCPKVERANVIRTRLGTTTDRTPLSGQ